MAFRKLSPIELRELLRTLIKEQIQTSDERHGSLEVLIAYGKPSRGISGGINATIDIVDPARGSLADTTFTLRTKGSLDLSVLDELQRIWDSELSDGTSFDVTVKTKEFGKEYKQFEQKGFVQSWEDLESLTSQAIMGYAKYLKSRANA
jgi:hypothetical protein